MKDSQIFSEVYSVLLSLGESFIKRVPDKILYIIKESTDEKLIKEVDIENGFEEYDISREALNIIAKLHYDYWCESDEEKEMLYNMLKDNEEKENQRLMSNMFKRK
ncbi:MAG: hypothetical protein J6I85_01170 [Clostridia bacterium]|nr:hypothetical protein [Clostridia bacterium]